MGLLRKAASAVALSDTNVSPPQVKPSSSVGLLKRSIQMLAAIPTLIRADEDFTRNIVEESKALADGVELPSRLFTTLRKRLSITKGALLLYDPLRLEYAPWASYGLDQTTLHRMRIPLGASETFNALANGDPLEVTTPAQRTDFQRFFSSREFAVLEQIILCPYIFEDTLIGVLLITEVRHPFENTQALLSCLKEVAADLSSLLQRARGSLMKLSQARATRPPATPEEQVARLLESRPAQGKKMLFLSLPLGPYISAIASSHEDLDLFRLREDVRNLLEAFLADLGVAIMLPGGSLLVCIQEMGREDIPLFLHQLRYFLGSRFAGAPYEERGSLIEVSKSRIWPDEGTDLRELVTSLSP
jgi:hypothetical protein